MLRDTRTFVGVSGGRAAIAAQLGELDRALGSGKHRGPLSGDGPPPGAVVTEPGLADPLLSRVPQVENGRPAGGDIEFDADAFGLPDMSVCCFRSWSGWLQSGGDFQQTLSLSGTLPR